MSTPEAKVKKQAFRHLADMGAFYFTPVTGGYGSSGIPDIVACYNGRFFGIECKAGKNKPTKLQEHFLERIRSAGGIAWVVNEENVDKIPAAMAIMAEKI